MVHIQDVTKNVVESVTNLADGAKKLLEFVGTDVVDSFAGFSDMADSYSNDAGSIDALVTDFSASAEQLLASINGVMDAIGGKQGGYRGSNRYKRYRREDRCCGREGSRD